MLATTRRWCSDLTSDGSSMDDGIRPRPERTFFTRPRQRDVRSFAVIRRVGTQPFLGLGLMSSRQSNASISGRSRFHAKVSDHLRSSPAFGRGFLKTAPGLKHVQEVDCERALAYVRHLRAASRDANYPYSMDSPATISPNTVWSNVSVLRAAWNRVRLGHPKAKSGLARVRMVTANPWEEIQNDLPERSKKPVVQFDLNADEFELLLDGFHGREVAQLFLIISLWAAGRLGGGL